MVDDEADETRVEQLLEQILESGDTPEEACRACPELLPELRAALRQLRQLEADVSALFPSSSDGDSHPPESWPPDGLPEVPGHDVLSFLGRGGMGIVFRARDVRLNRPVALKMILAGDFALPSQRQRFLREAEAIAAISHANIVQVYNAGESDRRPWYTMELVEAGNLAGKIGGAPQPARWSAALVRDIAQGVAVAHRHGIVHRDLKPANILLTADGTPKVTDFGLVRWGDEAGTTLTGSPVGTASYMAPEQARGASREIGPATDVYALGAILYELLTGRPPFRGETSAATIQQVLTGEVVPPKRLNPRVPRDLQTICLKCLHREGARRYASAAELADDLRRFLGGEPISARPVGTIERAVLWLRRHPAASTVFAAALALAVTLGTTAGWWYHQRNLAELDAKVELRQAEQYRQKADYANATAALDRATSRLGGIGSPSLRAMLDQEGAMVQLLRRLDEIHLERANVTGWVGLADALLTAPRREASPGKMDAGRRTPDERYEEVFRVAGIGSVGDDPAKVADRVRASSVSQSLIAALDDWTACAMRPETRSWIQSVLKVADSDPWRNRVRNPGNWKDGDVLQKLADEARVREQPPQILVLLSARLRAANCDARPLMNRVVLAYPTDFWANVEMAAANYQNDPREAIGYLRAARVIRPQLAHIPDVIAIMYGRQGRFREALPYNELAVQLDPGQALYHSNYSFVLARLQEYDRAIAEAREALRIDPGSDSPHEHLAYIYENQHRLDDALQEARTFRRLARPERVHEARAFLQGLLSRLNRDAEARDVWRELLSENPPDHQAWFGYAELCLFLGDESGYRRARTDLLNRFGGSDASITCERTAKACLLLDADPAELNTAAAMADRAVAKQRPAGEAYPYAVFAQGLAAYRLAHFDRAIALMSGRAAKVTLPCPKLVTAMALYRKGDPDQARKVLSEAIRSIDWNKPAETGRAEERWVAQILRREAESLIQPQPSGAASAPPVIGQRDAER
jgi:serine/threonine-protein kinase